MAAYGDLSMPTLHAGGNLLFQNSSGTYCLKIVPADITGNGPNAVVSAGARVQAGKIGDSASGTCAMWWVQVFTDDSANCCPLPPKTPDVVNTTAGVRVVHE
jgi:hypothetical protein